MAFEGEINRSEHQNANHHDQPHDRAYLGDASPQLDSAPGGHFHRVMRLAARQPFLPGTAKPCRPAIWPEGAFHVWRNCIIERCHSLSPSMKIASTCGSVILKKAARSSVI